jgi:hypothetical protein
MPKSKIILAIGFFIALLPFLGFPQSWNSFFEFAGGFSIVLLSVLIAVDRRLTLKAKMQKRQARKKAFADQGIVGNEEQHISDVADSTNQTSFPEV